MRWFQVSSDSYRNNIGSGASSVLASPSPTTPLLPGQPHQRAQRYTTHFTTSCPSWRFGTLTSLARFLKNELYWLPWCYILRNGITDFRS